MPSPPDPRPQRPGLTQMGEVETGNFARWDMNGRLDDSGIPAATGVPASATAPGTPGMIVAGPGFIYTCVATNTWERVATATWP